MRPTICFAVATIFCYATSIASSYARLGESSEEIKKRFGAPIKEQKIEATNLELKTYTNNDLVIDIFFANNKSLSEQYLRIVPGIEKTIRPFPKSLHKAILEANAQGSEWKLVSNASSNPKRYVRIDQKAIASLKLEKDQVIEVRISSQAFAKQFQNLKKP
ncbi:MAG: hypothetical protein AAGA18_10185 [Verrucomicrobiota bacterium]